MKKISTLFVVEYTNNHKGSISNTIREENSWVLEDTKNVIATQKFDGTAVNIADNVLYKRYDAKQGKSVPEGAIPCQEPDVVTGHHPHWVKCLRELNQDKYFFEAFDKQKNWEDGTYELCGEKVGINPEKIQGHLLIKHGSVVLNIKDWTFNGFKEFLSNPNNNIEGIVFHHKDGRMCKLRKTDFNIKR